MPDTVCIVQEGQIGENERTELAAGLERIAVEQLDASSSENDIRWVFVANGFGFTAGEPSKASLVIRSVPVGFPDDRREALLSRISGLWQKVTGCSANDVVVTAFDGPLPM